MKTAALKYYLAVVFVGFILASCGQRFFEETADGQNSTTVPIDTSSETIDEPPEPADSSTASAVTRVDHCYSQKELPCDNPSAYDDPACYISTIKNDIEAAKVNVQTFYVAISESAKLAQTGNSICPWDMVNRRCLWGNDTANGRTRETALASFKQALYAMYDLQNNSEDKNMYFELKIAGGNFYYREPIMISAKANFSGDIYYGPRLYENGQVVKKNTRGDYVVWNSNGDNTEYNSLTSPTDIATGNISVIPYDDKTVTLDGGCQYEYAALSDGSILNPDHPDFVWGYSALTRTCSEDLCSAEDLANSQSFCNSRGMVNIIKGDHIEIKGLTIQNAPQFGIQVQSWANKVLIADNDIKNTNSSGLISFYNSNVLIENNTVTEACASGLHENISIGYTYGFALYDNTIYDGWHDEKTAFAFSSDGYVGHNEIRGRGLTGVYVASGSQQLRVDGNRIHDLTQNTCLLIESEDGGSIKDIIIENNLCYNNPAGFGIAITQYNCTQDLNGDGVMLFECVYDENMDYQNLIIANNTIYQSGLNTTMGYGLKVDAGGAKNIVVANNIFGNNTTAQIAPSGTHMLDSDGTLKEAALILDKNLLYCQGESDSNNDGFSDCLNVSDRWYLGERVGYSSFSQGLFGNPLFVDPANGDFSLQSTSPARDAATNNQYVPTYDLDCNIRQAGQADLGASEYVSE